MDDDKTYVGRRARRYRCRRRWVSTPLVFCIEHFAM